MAERYKFIDPNSDPAASDGDPAPSPGARQAGSPGGSERIDSQVQKAQEQLLNLKRQQESIEKQKRELEELSRRQEELDRGKAEMMEKLTRALVIIDRQASEAQKRVEHLHAVTESFTSHLNGLEAINPKTWNGADLQKELNRALSMVDHARGEFNQSRTRILIDPAASEAANPEASHAAESDYEQLFHAGADRNFMYWLQAGLAFTLPLLILGLIALIAHCWLTLSLHP